MGLLTRVAGSSAFRGYSGDGGPATNAQLNGPAGLALDSFGDLYIADSGNRRVRKVTTATGIITTVAGNGLFYGILQDGLPAIFESLGSPSGIALDGSGNLYIADTYTHAIRKVSAETGIITTVAGDGRSGYIADGMQATNARLSSPFGVALDSSGNLLIADTGNNRIRKITATTGIITTLAGNGSLGYSGDGGPATAAQLYNPRAVVADASGNLLIADRGTCRVRKVTAGTITTVAGNGEWGALGDGGAAIIAQLGGPEGLALDGTGDIYIADRSNGLRKLSDGIITTVAGNGTRGYLGDGGPATNAQLNQPRSVALDGGGNLYIADSSSNTIRRVMAVTGMISTIAGNGAGGYSGDGLPSTSAQLNYPSGIAFDGAGDLYIADMGSHRIRKIAAASGIITTVAGNGTVGYSGDGGSGDQGNAQLPLWDCGGRFWQSLHRGYLQQPHPQGVGCDRHHHDSGRKWKQGLFRRWRAGG